MNKTTMICGCGAHVTVIDKNGLRGYDRNEKWICERAKPLVREKKGLEKRNDELLSRLGPLWERAVRVFDENLGNDERYKTMRASGSAPTDLDMEYIQERLREKEDDYKRIAIIGRVGMANEFEMKKNGIRLMEIEKSLERICFEEAVMKGIHE